jgi:Leucine-rich repeat (LRR) protein
MEGASNVAKGLKQNMQLQTLNLAWNGFGDSMPVLPLSEALSTCGLQHLDMSHNRLDRFGTLLIAGPLAQNTTLKKFIVDGNLISQVGARALFKAAKLA